MYRLPEQRYCCELTHYVDRTLFPLNDPLSRAMQERDIAHPNENAAMRGHLARKYGGGWLYNEVVGYIRLFVLDSQVRGEYFGTSQKRTRRTRHKVFELKSLKLVPERDIPDVTSSVAIFKTVLEYLADCRKELKPKYIDSSLLEELGPHIDWKEFIRSH